METKVSYYCWTTKFADIAFRMHHRLSDNSVVPIHDLPHVRESRPGKERFEIPNSGHNGNYLPLLTLRRGLVEGEPKSAVSCVPPDCFLQNAGLDLRTPMEKVPDRHR